MYGPPLPSPRRCLSCLVVTRFFGVCRLCCGTQTAAGRLSSRQTRHGKTKARQHGTENDVGGAGQQPQIWRARPSIRQARQPARDDMVAIALRQGADRPLGRTAGRGWQRHRPLRRSRGRADYLSRKKYHAHSWALLISGRLHNARRDIWIQRNYTELCPQPRLGAREAGIPGALASTAAGRPPQRRLNAASNLT